MSDFTKQENTQIEKFVAEKRETLRVRRFGSAGSRSRNVREGRGIRKDIARALTELTARKNAEKVASKQNKA